MHIRLMKQKCYCSKNAIALMLWEEVKIFHWSPPVVTSLAIVKFVSFLLIKFGLSKKDTSSHVYSNSDAQFLASILASQSIFLEDFLRSPLNPIFEY